MLSKNIENRILTGGVEDYIIIYFDRYAQRFGANVATEMAVKNYSKADPFYVQTVINDYFFGLPKKAQRIYFSKYIKK